MPSCIIYAAKKVIFSLVLVLTLIQSTNTVSQEFNFGDAMNHLNDDGIIEVPNTFTSFEAEVFRNLNVKKVIIPSSFTEISFRAFYLSAVEEVIIPDSVTVIAQEAFSYSKLTEISLPSSITLISSQAFFRSALTEITIPESVVTVEAEAFSDVPLTSLQLPEGITIKEYAFSGNKVEHLKIPDYTILGSYAFANNMAKSIEIGVNVNGYLGNSTYGSTEIFGNNNGHLKTIISNTEFGCNGGSGGLCVYGTSNLELTILNQGLITDNYPYYIAPDGGKLFISNFVNSPYSIRNSYPSEIIFIDGTSDYPLTNAPHSICTGVDTDLDGHSDCYDQFPNDASKWFSYDQDDEEPSIEYSLDGDNDGILDHFDDSVYTHVANCLEVDGAGGERSINTDGDGRNNCDDPDDDNDGLLDIYEPFFGTNPLLADSDFDGTLDGLDAFPLDNTESLDTDSDGIGNNTDTDDDNDGYTDFLDAFPTDANEWADSDLDGIGNNADSDDDNDGVADTEDAFPHTASESLDSDNDGVGDNADAFPNDATEMADTDLDGIGNNADPDDDNDGVADGDDGDPLNADIGIQPSQLISVAGNPVGVNGHSARISLSYDTSDGNNQLPGIGFRLHYSSEMLSFAGTENSIANDIIVDGDGPYQDDSDYDNDSNTDKYIIFGWAALNGDWPNSSLPTSLVDVVFNVSWEAFDQASITTPINFSKVSTTEGYNFEATNYTLNVLPATWDFDGNGQADALTDGLILLRHAFGVRGASLTDSVMATDSTMTSEEVQVAVEKALVIADVDGDGNVDALTDGLIVMRYMFGLTGETLMDGVVSANATRASAESAQQHIELYMPNNLLPPVQSEQSFIVGDWKLAGVPERADNTGPNSVLGWSARYDSLDEYCMDDDTYRFGINGSFEYFIDTTYTTEDTSSPFGSWEGNCGTLTAPWDGSYEMSYTINEENNTLTLLGKGAFIGHAEVANFVDQIMDPYLAPDEVLYDFAKIDENSMQLIIIGHLYVYRYMLVRVVETDNSPETECYEHRSYQNNAENSHTEIFQSFSRLDQNSVKVSIVSANDDPVDYLNIINLTGPAASLSELSISNGEASLIMSWLGVAPDSASLDVVWSKESYDGNWVNDKNFLPHIDLTVNCDALE
ncbi:leucine-rich repeat domain-containing protein [Porticoccaceae bacterium]|nr:leucine-rich repeat domain-containing protein [Porticoccaceae bacterium]